MDAEEAEQNMYMCTGEVEVAVSFINQNNTWKRHRKSEARSIYPLYGVAEKLGAPLMRRILQKNWFEDVHTTEIRGAQLHA